MSSHNLRVALIGAGYWGANLARNIAQNPACDLVLVADANLTTARHIADKWSARSTDDFSRVVGDVEIDAAVVATPAQTHYEVGRQLLAHGKHVLIEKPFATTRAEAENLVELAAANNLVAMAGHTFLYTAAVRYLKDLVVDGVLGEPVYAYSQRLNLGRIRSDCDAMWNFAPHDVSIFDFLVGELPLTVTATGHSYLQPTIADVVVGGLHYPDNFFATFHVSWLDPRKVRSLVIVGTEKMAVYDDTSTDRKIEIYESKAYVEADSTQVGAFSGPVEHSWKTRPGSILIPQVPHVEPLSAEIEDFRAAIVDARSPLSSPEHAVRVVSILERLTESLKRDEQLTV